MAVASDDPLLAGHVLANAYTNLYENGLRISDEELASVNLINPAIPNFLLPIVRSGNRAILRQGQTGIRGTAGSGVHRTSPVRSGSREGRAF